MKKQNSQALISYRMERSHESLRAAEIMLENNVLITSTSEVYGAAQCSNDGKQTINEHKITIPVP
ncbi:MAG: hypothetical protein WCO26_24865 [Deltaproteobacteria bacterium]